MSANTRKNTCEPCFSTPCACICTCVCVCVALVHTYFSLRFHLHLCLHRMCEPFSTQMQAQKRADERDLSAILEKRVKLRLHVLRSLRLHSRCERRLLLHLHLHLRCVCEPGLIFSSNHIPRISFADSGRQVTRLRALSSLSLSSLLPCAIA